MRVQSGQSGFSHCPSFLKVVTTTQVSQECPLLPGSLHIPAPLPSLSRIPQSKHQGDEGMRGPTAGLPGLPVPRRHQLWRALCRCPIQSPLPVRIQRHWKNKDAHHGASACAGPAPSSPVPGSASPDDDLTNPKASLAAGAAQTKMNPTWPRSSVTLTSLYSRPRDRGGLCHQRSVPSIALLTGCALLLLAAVQMSQYWPCGEKTAR